MNKAIQTRIKTIAILLETSSPTYMPKGDNISEITLPKDSAANNTIKMPEKTKNPNMM